jgi:hypothetical protein
MGVYNAETGTRVTKAAFPADAWTDPDPKLVLTAKLTRKSVYEGAENPDDTEGLKETLLYNEGDIIRTSERDALFPAADVTSFTPSTGLATAGGTTVTAEGTNLDGVTGITVGGTAATSVTVVDPTTLTFVTPAKAAGTYTVVVADDAGNATETNALTFA